MQGSIKAFVALATLMLAGCAGNCATSPSIGKQPPGEFHRLEGAGIENFYVLSDRVYSGSSPEGEEGFATLQKLGIKTIISVDGKAPQADMAAKYGMRYVHIPVGYDGIAPSNSLMIAKAAQSLPGPIFVHCHHGLHRGPTAAAIVCESLDGWTPEESEAWLHAAGTATNYPGLYRTVREFKLPTESELRQVPNRFTSHARTPGIVQTMVQIDEHFDILKAFQKAGFKPLPAHPDATPANESLILFELFREAHRTKQGSERGEKFQAELANAETATSELHSRLKETEANSTADFRPVDTAFQKVEKKCASCHKAYRN